MRYLYLAFFLFFIQNLSFSQLRLGIKTNYSKTLGSSNTAQFGDENGFLLYELDYVSSKDCIGLGLTSYYEIGNLFFQGDVLYRKCDINFALREFTSNNPIEQKFSERHHVLNVPIAAGIRYKKFNFGVGPIFNFNLQSDMVLNKMHNFQANPRKINLGFQFMVGYKLNNNIHIDMKYENTFNNISDQYQYKNLPTSLGVSPNILTVGLSLIF